MNADKAAGALFKLASKYTLRVTRSGNGTVTDTGTSGNLINCGGTNPITNKDCTEIILRSKHRCYQPTTITLAAAPAAKYKFTGWSGAGSGVCPGTGNCTVSMNGNKTITPVFAALRKYTLTVVKPTLGTVTGTYASGTVISCGVSGTGDCSEISYEGEATKAVVLTAQPKTGYKITGWSGAGTDCKTTETCTITMTVPAAANVSQNVTANFAPLKAYTLKVVKPTLGTVTGTYASGTVISCGVSGTGDCSEVSYEGEATKAVVLTAQPKSGYRFTGWSDAGCPGTGTCTITMTVSATANITKTVTASFATVPVSANRKGIAVDPYISGATFFEDVNGDGIKQDSEQVSTVSDANGNFSFANPLIVGSTIIMLQKGTHNGVAYTGTLKKVVDASGTLVTSPLTTLLANGWTADQIVGLLNEAGLPNITAEDLTKDPMANIATKDSEQLTAAQLEKIQASMSIYCFLSIMDGVIKLAKEGQIPVLALEFEGVTSGFDLTYDKFILHPNWKALLSMGVALIKDGLSVDVIASIDTALTTGTAICSQYHLPAPPAATAGDVIRGSVAISNYVISNVIESCKILDPDTGFPKCDYAPAPADYNVWRSDLGENFYIMRTKGNDCIKAGLQYAQQQAFPNYISCSTTFVIDADTGEVECGQ